MDLRLLEPPTNTVRKSLVKGVNIYSFFNRGRLSNTVDLPILVNDLWISKKLLMSKSWVRKERFCRRHGKGHVFDIDPVMIGSVPRYKRSDVGQC